MAQSSRTMQSTDDRSILLELYRELSETKDPRVQDGLQKQIDQIIAWNYLYYVNR